MLRTTFAAARPLRGCAVGIVRGWPAGSVQQISLIAFEMFAEKARQRPGQTKTGTLGNLENGYDVDLNHFEEIVGSCCMAQYCAKWLSKEPSQHSCH